MIVIDDDLELCDPPAGSILANMDEAAGQLRGSPQRAPRSSAIHRALYIDADGQVLHARTLEHPRSGQETTRLLVARGGTLTWLEAKYSSAREPGTWSRVVEPAS